MLRPPAAILFLTLLSCGKKEDFVHPPVPPAENAALASAQLLLARHHLATTCPERALPYLIASLNNDPRETTAAVLRETLTSTAFTVPAYRLDHPSTVTGFVDSGADLWVALAGPHPTAIRWSLEGDPRVEAIMFPSGNQTIESLTLSPDAKRILIHRGDINLLCDSQTLKPIANLGLLPPGIPPGSLQVFSENGLLVANPTSDGTSITWHLRDAATGQTLRSQSFPPHPLPIHASFMGSDLAVHSGDETSTIIPLDGEIQKYINTVPPSPIQPAPSTFAANGSAISKSIPIPRGHTGIPLEILSGFTLDPASQNLIGIPAPDRLPILSEVFPRTIPPTFRIYGSAAEIEERFAGAFPAEYPHLTSAAAAHAHILRATFATGDKNAILAALDALPAAGLPVATALFLALESGERDYISKAVSAARDIPDPLRQLLDKSFSVSPEAFAALRKEQDWIGYESPDFSKLLSGLNDQRKTAREGFTLPPSPSGADIEAFITLLLSPASINALGEIEIADIAASTASSLAENEETASSALQLVAIAGRFGSGHARLLRITATARTSLEDFEKAHEAWIDLITNQPESSHHATDYAEAAYSAFETNHADQAMEILTTGLFRFPDDVRFAIQAGWIALVTDHPQQAYNYISKATFLGIPPDEIEHTTALLAITTLQLGDNDAADTHIKQLQAIDPKWKNPETIETLPWPEPLKASLRQLLWIP